MTATKKELDDKQMAQSLIYWLFCVMSKGCYGTCKMCVDMMYFLYHGLPTVI